MNEILLLALNQSQEALYSPSVKMHSACVLA